MFLFLNMYQADLKTSFDITSLIAFDVPVLSVYAVGFGLWRLMPFRSTWQTKGIGGNRHEDKGVGQPIRLKQAEISSMATSGVYALACSYSNTVLLNNIVLSIGLGLLVNLSGIQLWSFLQTGLALLAKPALTCALFVLGANLCSYKIREEWIPALWASLVKLLLLPSLVYVFGHEILYMDSTSLSVVVLIAEI
ncbi:hypothetical protein [Shewanella surugensis]|uniref:AEC family transporter n=1 Tax=Shewanella surugensis TaxID=212020 RepID=A0ABT0LJB5_9GAMM|nr:hypothetical protein [Shewanella surugensis]MCL1127781.1 hypothetical protein [Shewanella surugensis]